MYIYVCQVHDIVYIAGNFFGDINNLLCPQYTFHAVLNSGGTNIVLNPQTQTHDGGIL